MSVINQEIREQAEIILQLKFTELIPLKIRRV